MEPNGTNIWFYIKDRQQKGPVGIFELSKLFEQGVLNNNTYLWTEGKDSWEMAKNNESFKNYGAANSPPELSQPETETPPWPRYKPVVRLIAKLFDLSVLTVIISTFISIFSLDLILKTSKFTLFIIYLLLWILFEPFMLTIFGTTVGKSLLNLKVKNINGELLDYLTAFKRNLYLFVPGKGLGFPLLMLTSNVLPLFSLRKKTRSLWDQEAGTIVLYGTVSLTRLLLGVSLPLAVFIIGIILSGYH